MRGDSGLIGSSDVKQNSNVKDNSDAKRWDYDVKAWLPTHNNQ